MKIRAFLAVALVGGVCAAAERSQAVTATAPKAEDAAATGKTDRAGAARAEIDEQKDEFAKLMRQRLGLLEQSEQSMRVISAARNTTDGGAGARSETGIRYREAVLATEKALDWHPRIKALQELYDVAQTDKVAVSRLQSAIVDAWRDERTDRETRLNKRLSEAGENMEAAAREIRKQAGVKDARNLPESDQKRIEELRIAYTSEVAAIKFEATNKTDAASVEAAREKDGSTARFGELNARYKELEQTQADLKARMARLRDELRKSDPAIAKLERAAYEASQKHVTAMDANPDVAAAQKFLETVDEERVKIDKRVRVLRRAILSKDPESRTMLDRQAESGGLALVGEDFWKEEN
jgi:hypothetical protein